MIQVIEIVNIAHIGVMKKKSKQRIKRVAVITTVLLIVGLMVGGALLGTLGSMPTQKVKAMTSARAMITLEASTGRVLFSHNEHERLAVASTTKIVTAITVIENVDNLDQEVRVSDKAIGIEGTSIYIQKGETLSVRELLLGLMLRSGNDCATALAIHVSGSVEKFAELMNKTAWDAGARNSSFKNPHGLDEEGHLTTAYDLGMISAYSMQNETFREIVATKDTRIEGEIGTETNPRSIANKNRLLRSNSDVVGIKTGFTSKAGRCYVGAMDDKGMTVICVVLNCGPMFEEAQSLMSRALKEFYMFKVLDHTKVQTPTHLSPSGVSQAMIEKDVHYPIRPGEENNFEITINEHHVVVHFDKERIDKAKRCA